MSSRAVLWLRRDLRRGDLPALAVAAAQGQVMPLFVIHPAMWERAGEVRRAWMAANVLAAESAYEGALCVRVGKPCEVVPAFAAECRARTVHVTRETTPSGTRRDRRTAERLAVQGMELIETGTPYAVGPGLVRTAAGGPYRVFTPFAKAWRAHGWPAPANQPRGLVLRTAGSDPRGRQLLHQAVAHSPIQLPEAGEAAALQRCREFIETALVSYGQGRNRPDLDLTSRLSAYLTVGAIHPRTILAALADRRSVDGGPGGGQGSDRFVTELAWREFYADVLYHHPASAWTDLRDQLADLEYDEPAAGDAADRRAETAADVEAWRQGRTGYPLVDAGMRQLLHEGWMHNRVRMVTASFLTKDLHVHWPVGARHFLEHLIDGDVASNSHGWQWVAGTGTDAAPYFRVFNPVGQGRRFDPDGGYVRSHVPELAHLPGPAVHEPWLHPDGYRQGYPHRIVDHDQERRVALARYENTRR